MTKQQFNLEAFRKWLIEQRHIQEELMKDENNAIVVLVRETRALTLRRVEAELDCFLEKSND